MDFGIPGAIGYKKHGTTVVPDSKERHSTMAATGAPIFITNAQSYRVDHHNRP